MSKMILLIFLPFFITKTSAVCLPSFNPNEYNYQLPYYGNPAAFENEAVQFSQSPDFGAYNNLDGNTPHPFRYPELITGIPGRIWRYNRDIERANEIFKQEKLPAIKEQPFINGRFNGYQQFNSFPQKGLINCEPYAGLYANNFHGGYYSNLYNLAAPYIYHEKYLDYFKSPTGYNFPKNMDFTATQMNDLDLEEMRNIFGNKWEQLQDLYSLRYLMFLRSLYEPNFLKHVNIDQYYKLAMLQNFNRYKTMPPFIRPEYNLNNINQHVFSYLDYLQSLHPGLFNLYQPYPFPQWGTYPGTTDYQQFPINNQQYFGDRFQNSSKNEVKNVTTNVDDENSERVLEKEEKFDNKPDGYKETGIKDETDQNNEYAGDKLTVDKDEINKNNQYAEEEFDKIQVETGNKYQSTKGDVSSSLEVERSSEAGRMDGRNGSTENQITYKNGGLMEAIRKTPQKISLTLEIPSETIERTSEMHRSGSAYGGLNQGIEDVDKYEVHGFKNGAGGDFGKNTRAETSQHGGWKLDNFGSNQAGKFGLKGKQDFHSDGHNWHKGRTSLLHIFPPPLPTNRKSGGGNGRYNFIYGGGSQNAPGGGGFDQMFPTGWGGRLGGGGFRGMHTSDGNFDQMFTIGSDMNLEKGGRGEFSITTESGSKPDDFFTGSGLSKNGVGGRRDESPLSVGSGSKREGIFIGGGGDSGVTFSTGGDLEKGGFSFPSGSLGKSSFVGEGGTFPRETTNKLSGNSNGWNFSARFNDETEESSTATVKDKIDGGASKKAATNIAKEPVDKRSDTVTEKVKNVEATKV